MERSELRTQLRFVWVSGAPGFDRSRHPACMHIAGVRAVDRLRTHMVELQVHAGVYCHVARKAGPQDVGPE
jgi:hypothetical protein